MSVVVTRLDVKHFVYLDILLSIIESFSKAAPTLKRVFQFVFFVGAFVCLNRLDYDVMVLCLLTVSVKFLTKALMTDHLHFKVLLSTEAKMYI